jgi:hypothetical protein
MSISHGYLDSSHSLTTIDGMDSITFMINVVVRFMYVVSLRCSWPFGPLLEKSCDFADTRRSVSEISVATNTLDSLYPLDPHYALDACCFCAFSSSFYLSGVPRF